MITGGSSLGAAKAFLAAHKPLPALACDNSGECLRFWKQQLQKNPDYNAVSVRTEPGQAAAAVWEALGLLEDKKYAKTMTLPNIVATQKDLDAWTKVTPPGNVMTWLWSRDQFESAVKQIKAGQKVTPPPIPTTAP